MKKKCVSLFYGLPGFWIQQTRQQYRLDLCDASGKIEETSVSLVFVQTVSLFIWSFRLCLHEFQYAGTFALQLWPLVINGIYFIFKCVRQERISTRGSVHPSVHPSVPPSVPQSVCWSVGLLRLCKNRVSRLFLATVRSYTETNDQPTCFQSLFTRLFVHLSLHTYVT